MNDIIVEHKEFMSLEKTNVEGVDPGRSSHARRLRLQIDQLYGTDFMAWCESQAEILRARQYEQLDIVNLVEELEDMGRSEFRTTLSLVRQIIIHILKVQTFPQDQACNHWKGEIITCQSDLEDLVSGSIRYRFEQRGEFDVQQRKALKYLSTKYPNTDVQPLNPMSLDEVITWLPDKTGLCQAGQS